jgi:hypothetical protein
MKRLVVAAGLMLLAACAFAAERRWLITPEEAARAGAGAAVETAEPMSAPPGYGPLIVIEDPRLLERLRSPVNILVSFRPGESGLPPDMKSFSATLRGFINIDITARLREYLRETTLAVDRADLPAGNHRIRMVVADTGGNLTARDLVLVVVEAGE